MLFQENMELLGDGYQGDVIGESTPDVLVNEFVCFLALIFSSLIIFIDIIACLIYHYVYLFMSHPGF